MLRMLALLLALAAPIPTESPPDTVSARPLEPTAIQVTFEKTPVSEQVSVGVTVSEVTMRLERMPLEQGQFVLFLPRRDTSLATSQLLARSYSNWHNMTGSTRNDARNAYRPPAA